MLQQQQQVALMNQGKMLEETMRNQQVQSTKLLAFEEKLVSFGEKCDVLASHSSEPPKKKVKVTHDISVSFFVCSKHLTWYLCVFSQKKIYMVHDELENKFKVEER